MRKIIWLLSAVLAMVACKQEPVDYTLLSGKFENSQGLKEFTIVGTNLSQKIVLNEDNTFSDTIRPVKSGYYQLKLGRSSLPLYLEPGDNLKLTLDFSNKQTPLTFQEGKALAVNEYLVNKKGANQKALEERGGVRGLFALEEEDFLKILDTMKQEQLKLAAATKGLPENVVNLEKKNAEYDYLYNLSLYGDYHGYLTKNENFKPSERITKPLEAVDYTIAEDYNQFGTYKALTTTYFMNKYYKDDADKAAVIEEVKKTGIVNLKNDFAASLISGLSLGAKDLAATATQVKSLTTDADVLKSLDKFMKKAENLAQGKPSPTFEYKDIRGRKVSLASLKGRLVYIDVWATWCGPCKGEIPYLKKLEKEYHRKRIRFVSISVDKDKAAWEKMVKDQKLGGIQLYAGDNWQTEFLQSYSINGIPRFILLDKKGNIISADAPRPSSEKIRPLLNEWLKK